MAEDRIRLVRKDTAPSIVFTLTDEATGNAIDISHPSTVVRLKFRKEGTTTLLQTIVCTKPGGVNVVKATWPAASLDVDPGYYESELEITFNDGSVQTAFELQKYTLRQDL